MKIMKANTAIAISDGAPQWVEKNRHEYTTEDKKKANLDNVAKDILYKTLDKNMFSKIKTCATAKEIWEKLTQICEENDETKENNTGTQGRGDRPAELPLCPARLPETPANGQRRPKQQKQENKYEVKPQYEELSKQINMQHAINQCYECKRLSKEIDQLGQCINRQIISSRLYTTVYQPGNHRSVIIEARHPITTRWARQISQPANRFRLASKSQGRRLPATNLCKALTYQNKAQINERKLTQKLTLGNRRSNLLNETSNSRTSRAYGISQVVAPSFQTSMNGKSKSQGVQRHQERQKQRLNAMENGGGKLRKLTTGTHTSHNKPVATIQSQRPNATIQTQAKPKAGIFLTAGTRRKPCNAAFPLIKTTSRCPLDWFLKSTAGHPVATFKTRRLTQSNDVTAPTSTLPVDA
ncbi:hypothetical protein F511_18696 [Dorcoceras hygrometricum]|uniref:Uncharacterized protein n=1 Tax=Dorcoceras hygrometricum TaxID=472368 RepID=A0A2Z7B648_9LAMI|nr:hypothetical protein F511_18696 [Dorcoceras hygrometricum]